MGVLPNLIAFIFASDGCCCLLDICSVLLALCSITLEKSIDVVRNACDTNSFSLSLKINFPDKLDSGITQRFHKNGGVHAVKLCTSHDDVLSKSVESKEREN